MTCNLCGARKPDVIETPTIEDYHFSRLRSQKENRYINRDLKERDDYRRNSRDDRRNTIKQQPYIKSMNYNMNYNGGNNSFNMMHHNQGPGVFKEGDWRCVKCNNVNFRWRKFCNRCSEPVQTTINMNMSNYSKYQDRRRYSKSRSRDRSRDKSKDRKPKKYSNKVIRSNSQSSERERMNIGMFPNMGTINPYSNMANINMINHNQNLGMNFSGMSNLINSNLIGNMGLNSMTYNSLGAPINIPPQPNKINLNNQRMFNPMQGMINANVNLSSLGLGNISSLDPMNPFYNNYDSYQGRDRDQVPDKKRDRKNEDRSSLFSESVSDEDKIDIFQEKKDSISSGSRKRKN